MPICLQWKGFMISTKVDYAKIVHEGGGARTGIKPSKGWPFLSLAYREVITRNLNRIIYQHFRSLSPAKLAAFGMRYQKGGRYGGLLIEGAGGRLLKLDKELNFKVLRKGLDLGRGKYKHGGLTSKERRLHNRLKKRESELL